MGWRVFNEPLPAERALLEEVQERAAAGGLPGPGWQEMRARPERRVWRLPGPPVLYLKLQHYRSFRVRFRYALRRPPTLKEGMHCLRLRSLGLTGPEPLLHGTFGAGPWRRWSLLLTRELAGQPAAQALAGGSLDLAGLAGLVDRLRAAGVLHLDLHLNNLLAGPGGEVRLLDLQSLRIASHPLGPGPVLAMAVKLGDALLHQGFLAEAGPWLSALDQALPRPPSAAAFRHRLERNRAREVGRRVRRCLVESSQFTRLRQGGVRLYRRRETRADEMVAAAELAWAQRREVVVTPSGTCCLVGATGRLRRLWLGFRRQEVLGRCDRPPLALVVRGLPWLGRACLVFPPCWERGDLEDHLARLEGGEG